MKKQLNFQIDNGEVFFADEITVVHKPTKLLFDFKSVTPRFDVRSRDQQPMKIKHNMVVMDIFMAKEVLKIIQDNLKAYEKKFGKITMPKEFEKAKKQIEKAKKEQTIETPSYFG